MPPVGALRSLSSLVVPPRCAVCRRASDPRDLLCAGCAGTIAAGPAGRGAVAGVGSLCWAAPYAGPARGLVTALKFRAGLGLAAVAGDGVAAAVAVAPAIALAPGPLTVVAAPPAPLRHRHRGFDPAELIATEVAKRLGVERAVALRRANGPRQVGRPRRERLAAPPRVRATGPAPRRVLLVDDVLTTGATLAACASALRDAGAAEVRGAVFARALG